MKIKKSIHHTKSLMGAGITLALLVPCLVGCQQTSSTPTVVSAQETSHPILPSPAPTIMGAPSAGKSVVAYRVARTDDGAHLEPVAVPAANSASKSAAAALDKMAEMDDSPLPKGTRVRSVKFSQDLAIVDFNKAFADNYSGGDEREALILNAITATMGQFPHVKRVQLLVEGEKPQMGGSQDLMQPLDVPPSVVTVTEKPRDSEEGEQR